MASNLGFHGLKLLLTYLKTVLLVFTLSSSATLAASIADLKSRDGPIAKGIDLRVLPIGDSITYGAKDPKENGYRLALHDMLTKRGNKVDFVGSVESGTFEDKQHEGHRTKVIQQIYDDSDLGIFAAANIVLLHAGTNDMKSDNGAKNAPEHLRLLMKKIYDHSPDTALLVAQIIPSTTSEYQDRIDKYYNPKIPGICEDFTKQGKRCMVVKMNEAVSTHDLADNLHPTPDGYEDMAEYWMAAIDDASDKGYITKAPKGEHAPGSNCRAAPLWYDEGQVAMGARIATTDGGFTQTWSHKGISKAGTCHRENLQFMDLDGDGRKDYACVDDDGKVSVYLNTKDKGWVDAGVIATGKSVKDGKGVLFGDLNGDGVDDLIHVDDKSGDVVAWINRGKNSKSTGSDDKWLWDSLGKIAGGVGATRDKLQMVDIDGDGRDDFCLIDRSTGSITAWLNGGYNPVPDYHKLGEIATGASTGDNDTVILGDFTGEGRADYMIVDKHGKTKGLVNRRVAVSMIPRWAPVQTFAEGPDGARQHEVRLVDITGDGKVDYLIVGPKGSIELWENTGKGGKYQAGDGVFLCDLDGDGVDDYFWVNENGQGWGYLNRGKTTDAWHDLGQIAKGHHDRNMVRMGVMTASGRADYIVLDATGRAVWYRNLGEDQNYGWGPATEIATGPKHTIETKYGWKFHPEAVKFADVDGDGLDDYLYVYRNGAVVMWRNTGADPPNWEPDILVAEGPADGVWGRDVWFRDTNGDGVPDYLAIDRITGFTRVWHGHGPHHDGSIGYIWDKPLEFAKGPAIFYGAYGRIAEMTGDSRADYVVVDPDSAAVYLWHNNCNEIPSSDPGGDNGSKKCSYTVHNPNSWLESGGAQGLDDYLVKNGKKIYNQDKTDEYYWLDDWAAKADDHFQGTDGSLYLDCSDLSSDTQCSAPPPGKNFETCLNFPPEWWWSRQIIAGVHDSFSHAYSLLLLNSTVTLARIKQMGQDFKDERPPDTAAINKFLGNAALVFGFSGFVAGKASVLGGDILGVLSTISYFANTNVKPPSDSGDTVEAATDSAMAYLGDMMANTGDGLMKALKAFVGKGTAQEVEDYFTPIRGGIDLTNNPWQSLICQILDGGDFLQRPEETGVVEALQGGLDLLAKSIVARLLNALQYFVVAAYSTESDPRAEEMCSRSKEATRFIDDRCYYFVRRSAGQSDSQNVPGDVVDKIEDHYGISLYDLMKNVKDCENEKTDTDIYSGPGYPPCFFGMAVAEVGISAQPLKSPVNKDSLPSWVPYDKDHWVISTADFCAVLDPPVGQNYACDSLFLPGGRPPSR